MTLTRARAATATTTTTGGKPGYIYLASPYSHELPEVREQRFREAQRAAAWLFVKGIWVYSPIAHWHDITKWHSLPTHAEPHKAANDAFQAKATATYVLCLEGWASSKGVKGEIEFALRLHQPVLALCPQGESYKLGLAP